MADIVLGVTGGIAAYKAVSLLRELTESGHDVTVVPTAAAPVSYTHLTLPTIRLVEM